MCLLPISMAQAISATTKGKVQGNAPYIKFDGEEQAESALAHMFSIKLSDGRYYAPTDAQVRKGGTIDWNTPDDLIKLPVLGQTVADIEMLIPSPSQSISLTDLIITNNNWRDDDGDGQGPNGVYITPTTGELKMELRNNNNKIFDRRDPLDFLCNSQTAYYKLSLSAPGYQLMTQYGMPREAISTAFTVNYYINPNESRTKVCHVGRYLHSSPIVYAEIYSDPTKNFPRTGFDGVGFFIKLPYETPEGIESIIKATEDTPGSRIVTQGGVTMTLFSGKGVISMRLNGPTDKTGGGTFTPSTFTLKSGDGKPIYSFALSKWFINSYDWKSYKESKEARYCQMLNGNYRIPSVQEYSNRERTDAPDYTSGRASPGTGNGKRMGIMDPRDDGKGGLFSEWGIAYKYSWTHGYYISIDRDSDDGKLLVSGEDGTVSGVKDTEGRLVDACVAP